MNNISIFVKFRNIVFSFKIFGTKAFFKESSVYVDSSPYLNKAINRFSR